MRNKAGKSGVLIIVLAAIILIALVPWYFIVARYLGFGSDSESDSERNENTAVTQTAPPVVEPPPEPVQTPQPTPEPIFEPEVPLHETITSIRTDYPMLTGELNEIASHHDSVAVSLVFFDGGTGKYFTYEHGYADVEEKRVVNVDTKFRVASLSKLVTVLCAMVLVDKDLIDLDTDISVYLGYEVKNTNYPGTAITTRMLMQHTSSIFDSGAFQMSRDRNSSESLRYLLERGSSFRRNNPGTVFEYTNFGYSVLAAVCENAAGKTLNTLAREVLFEPLEIDAAYVPSTMHDTRNIAAIYNDRHVMTRSVQSQLEIRESETFGHDLHLAQGNLTISIIDYARILVMLGNGGVLNDVRILSSEAVREIHNTSVEGASYRQGLGTRFSTGDFIDNLGFYWHTGSAYGTFAQYIYNHSDNMNRGVVVVTTGAKTDRERNGMVTVCSKLSSVAWEELSAIVDFEDHYDDDDDEFDG